MLTDTAIKKAKPTAKQYKLPDEKGLHLLVRTNGNKLWQFRFRHEGKEKTASLGQYPDVSLSDARQKRDDLRKLVATGTDPVAAKRIAKAAKEASAINTFEAVARDWHEHWKASRSDSHVAQVLRRFEADVFPAIGSRPVADIEAPELVQLVKAIAKRGAIDVAKRALQTSGQVFRFAIAHGKAKRNPATDIKPSDILPQRKAENYARIGAPELPALLRKIEGYQGTPVTRMAIKLMALTFVRTGELIGAKWTEFDLDAARWDIPADRMKMRTPHIVPLSTQAIDVLRVLESVTGENVLLFPGERKKGKPMSNNTILKALEIMGYKGRMTGHGFRGVASTLLHEQGFEHAHIELQLAHAERNEVSAAYNHALYLPQRAAMMQAWGDYLDGLRTGQISPLGRLAA
ncbi:integrase arm-type DNA-binding domain-containing protein [Paucibacter sp. TC2R-5]|uniref:tyrosine-type recombinase/integrase n=1 Tax=Paucibacter sp. TC2R-5 TaxID=2893555 RepID=UPI0021E4A83A|nr:integrase arm-type DNA-binding domain-containing protein [Paucibacter sp. TC2R-5]MCV2360994.1 integrase arm-type DNA-binding domain-containing protein [Paucibacter sp. TC2R-5]